MVKPTDEEYTAVWWSFSFPDVLGPRPNLWVPGAIEELRNSLYRIFSLVVILRVSGMDEQELIRRLHGRDQ